ncbi:MAG: hypothetical protein CSB46_02305 [Micrococcales bacterium]|nr:MAG: hypothetical protein CSB46_02305 [Micrococcales bacterium]
MTGTGGPATDRVLMPPRTATYAREKDATRVRDAPGTSKHAARCTRHVLCRSQADMERETPPAQ